MPTSLCVHCLPCPRPHTPPGLARSPRRRLAPRCPTHQWWRVGVGTLTDIRLKFFFLVMRFRPEVIVDLRADGQRVVYEALRECPQP
jgi:hypothetical protein